MIRKITYIWFYWLLKKNQLVVITLSEVLVEKKMYNFRNLQELET